ncbi:uncharacterized protein FOMMEDRAFT_153137 [Fomitiporia mediterranea MF3/22]|uniref:uncharacterized protein n=1 Tax=Fomitiporia mediterranea (strain MF3/22) TaxID=694068 RepID=UPI0004407CD6|nr:uncharacterized protein FOMMEDRAFT_153137 [Fomitiporia mediterranea MF3/22]EJD05796.1 hypothetical protein FOMMEDRAFT_153137 [Fomitiporia mediterranea MF3/22]
MSIYLSIEMEMCIGAAVQEISDIAGPARDYWNHVDVHALCGNSPDLVEFHETSPFLECTMPRRSFRASAPITLGYHLSHENSVNEAACAGDQGKCLYEVASHAARD